MRSEIQASNGAEHKCLPKGEFRESADRCNLPATYLDCNLLGLQLACNLQPG